MKRRDVRLFIVVLIFIGTIPIWSSAQKKLKDRVIVPAWKIQIVDEAGNPAKNVLVRQIWQDYDIEEDSHEEDAFSDAQGYVSFQERSEKSESRATRARKKLKNLRKFGVHASFGVDAYILAWGQNSRCQRLEGNAGYKEGTPLQSVLQMRVVGLSSFKCTP